MEVLGIVGSSIEEPVPEDPPLNLVLSMVGYHVGLCQGFTCVLDMVQILLREIYFRRKAVLFYPKGFAQVALTGLFSFRDSMDPNIRWEVVGDTL